MNTIQSMRSVVHSRYDRPSGTSSRPPTVGPIPGMHRMAPYPVWCGPYIPASNTQSWVKDQNWSRNHGVVIVAWKTPKVAAHVKERRRGFGPRSTTEAVTFAGELGAYATASDRACTEFRDRNPDMVSVYRANERGLPWAPKWRHVSGKG